ncbi:MAG: MarR family transcriptional regulator [Methanobrevibacter sp.]|uniref:MarR family winged helix-turn-helix transcriptional regulator n=1 Tax=Methanobrevibacter sp. TaxID=66852 RepID=UPI0026DF20F5|nr:MarR family transcriptional regulator [Methanobrevibacter sp.]MDO5848416.1 MarR family transcriptional regulator [Methanobrevibacter sp.]
MIDYREIVEDSPFILCHFITLLKTHDYYLNQFLKQTDISLGQYYMLMYIYENGNFNQSDIAKVCLMNRSGVSRAFKEFEKNGLIKREVDENNKRAYKITLTQKGIDTAEFLQQKENEWQEMICEDLDMDIDELKDLLEKLALKSLFYNREKFLG